MDRILDYHEFYEEVKEGDYVPTRVDYDWIQENEDFMRETLFSIYQTYTRLKDPFLLKPLLKLYQDVIIAAHMNFPNNGSYM